MAAPQQEETSGFDIGDEDAVSRQRNSPGRLATYSPHVPSRPGTPTGINDTDPFLNSQDRNLSNTKICFRSEYVAPARSPKTRCFHYLPVVFVLLSFSVIYGIFVAYHLKPAMLNDFTHLGFLSNRTAMVLFTTHFLCFLFLANYILCATVDPGSVPSTTEWNIYNTNEEVVAPTLCETKKSGARRICKWCAKYKPDRTHHCRVCERCVLKMDHHCPWVYNCIGWRNHKYFFLCVFYASVLSCFIAILSYPTVKHVIGNPLVPFSDLTMLMVGEVLSIFFGTICAIFLCFHVWLMCQAFTTIEFCEKRNSSTMLLGGSIWSGGLLRNISSVLGENPFLWLLPIDDRVGDGIMFTAQIPVDGSDDVEECYYNENSAFLKMARETKQFEPILEV